MNNIQLAQRIKEKCKENNIAINKMLMDCNLTKSFIYDLEKRSSYPSCDRIFRIANYLNCSSDYLLGLENKKKSNDLQENQKKILNLFDKLTENYQKQAISQVLELVIEMSQKQDEEANAKKSYISALGGGVFEIDEELAKYIEENAVED